MNPRRSTIRLALGRVATMLTAALAVCALPQQLAAQRRTDIETTGSRVGSTAQDVAVIRMNQDAEIAEILALIEAGDDRAAVDRARAYVESLRAARPADESPASGARYFALNALCIALTRTGEIDEALSTCTSAIELAPKRWTALNSRGSAHFAARDYASALADYRAARSLLDADDDPVETIEHNIALTEQRLNRQR